MAWARAARLASHGLWLASMQPGFTRFARALHDPDAAQRALLERHLRAEADTAWGRRHGYAAIRDLAAFQDRVPVSTYDDLADDVRRAASGEQRVLTAEPVRFFERSSGSSSASKLIPYTDGLKAQFAAATDPWLASLHHRFGGVVGGRAYWSISPVARAPERTPGGHAIGIEDDAEYLSPFAQALMGRLLAVPREVAREPDVDRWRVATLRHLLAAEDLSLLSIWSPSFLTVLMRALEARWDSIVGALPRARRARLDAAVRARGLVGEALWPRLRVLSCWTDAAARAAVAGLRAYFPTIPIEPKGLLATEGAVSLPFLDQRVDAAVEDPELGPLVPSVRPLAVASHVIELSPADDPDARPVAPSRLDVGARYVPLLTTAGGFVRYRLGDEVECTGYLRRAPTIAFVGKRDAVSDLCGEKLHASHAQVALDAARAMTGARLRFATLVPLAGPARYALLVDARDEGAGLAALRAEVEARLADNPHYAYARRLGQLGPLELRVVADAEAYYLAAKMAAGMRAGDVKATPLDPRWIEPPARPLEETT